MRSSQLPPSDKYSRAKRPRVEPLAAACVLPQDRDLLPSSTLSLWLGRGKALSAIISNICWPLLRCLPSGSSQSFLSACAFFSLPLHFLLQPVRQLLCCVCLALCIEGKGHCSFCVQNPNLPCWIISKPKSLASCCISLNNTLESSRDCGPRNPLQMYIKRTRSGKEKRSLL